MIELRPLQEYIEGMRKAHPRLIAGQVFIERQARLKRRMDHHKAALGELIRASSDPDRARYILSRWGHRGLPLADQRQFFQSQLVAAGLLTRAKSESIDIEYHEPD